MIKVFLVEDEYIVREGMKNNVNWEDEDMILVGEASDGELALPMIQHLKPDIIITDIKMPFMDGLELSKLVKKNLPDTKIIIISGYSEFEYAKEAINIGVTDFLVKPISPANLLENVKKVANAIKKEKENKELIVKYKQEMNENKRLDKIDLFADIITNRKEMPEILKKAEDLEIELISSNYNIVLLKMYLKTENDNYSKELVRAMNLIDKKFDNSNDYIIFNRGVEGFAFIVKNTEMDINANINKIILEVENELESFAEISYCMGIGKEVSRIREIKESFDAANKATAYRYISNKDKIIRSENLTDELYIKNLDTTASNTDLKDNDLDDDLSYKDISTLNKNVIQDFLRSGHLDEVNGFVEDYCKSLGLKTLNSLLLRQYLTMNIFFTTISFIEELGCRDNFEEKKEYFQKLTTRINTLEEVLTYFIDLIECALIIRDTIANKKYLAIIEMSKKYIQDNYNDYDISLNQVASIVAMSPSHFSTIFKQEMDISFVEYLTSLRMEKAKEYLRCTNMKNFEIADAIGYKDSHYFSYLFKKYFNLTPKEYKNKLRNGV